MNNQLFYDRCGELNITWWHEEDKVEMLIRIADWYKLPPLWRLLLNMSCYDAKWIDGRTELRVYSWNCYGAMSALLSLPAELSGHVAKRAYYHWGHCYTCFPITHVERDAAGEDHLVFGDDPCDAADLGDGKTERSDPPHPLKGLHGVEGSDV